ncbi:MAG: 3-oxoacyl-ACP reductase family protein [Dehalococcoidia bacterium]|nr:3-oxoacyl-ACP reductase family protein [Dehalococcoidia bacterium]
MAGALDGQVAVVTGGSRGIGRACAVGLAQEGASVVINYTSNAAAAEETKKACEAAGAKVLVVQADVSDAAQAKALIEAAEKEFGKVDILVNNAGINRDRTIQRMSVEEWDTVVQTDLSSIFYTTNAALGGMRERNYGRIINMSSVIGQMGNVGQANYAAAKAGMIAFTKTAAKELSRFGITVNAVCPGFVETDMVAALSEDVKKTLIGLIPLGRFGTAEEVADTVVFICKPSGAWYTGAQFSMNGGQYM